MDGHLSARHWVALASFTVLFAAATGTTRWQPTPPRGATRLITPRISFLCQANWHAAEALGLFEREGLVVERFPPARDTHGVPDLLQANVNNRAVWPDFLSIDHMFLGEFVERNADYYFVAGEHSGCHQLLVPAQSLIRSIGDLRGKRVLRHAAGLGLLWAGVLGQAGVKFDEVRWITGQHVGGSLELERYVRDAFARGELDAAGVADPTGEALKEAGIARHLASNTWTPPMNGWFCCMLAIRRSIVDRQPDVARRIVRVLRASAAFVEREPRRAAEFAFKNGMQTSASVETAARLLKEYTWVTSHDIGADLERYFEMQQRHAPLATKLTPRQLRERFFRPIE